MGGTNDVFLTKILFILMALLLIIYDGIVDIMRTLNGDMKVFFITVVIVIIGVVSGAKGETGHVLYNYDLKLAYSFGIGMGTSLQKIDSSANLEFFFRGINDVFAKNSLLLSAQAVRGLKSELANSVNDGGRYQRSPENYSSSQEGDARHLNKEQQTGYSLGLDYGTRLFEFVPELNLEYAFEGVKDVFSGAPLLLDLHEAREMRSIFGENKDKQHLHALQQKNLYEGIEFIKNNKNKRDVLITKSGLQYKVIRKGRGDKPTEHAKVVVQYVGKLLDDTEFVNTTKTGAVTLQVDQLVPGLKEGLRLMNIGSKYQFYLPARMAYGYKGYGCKIGPYAVLKFDVELKSFIRNGL